MSHVAQVEGLEIHDLAALGEACAALGLELVLGQKTYRWYGRSVGDFPLPAGFTAAELGHCEHAIRVPGSKATYEVGVVSRRDANGQALPGFTLLWDFWNRGYGMMDKVGAGCGLLRQQYAAAGVRKVLAKRFSRQKSEMLPNGVLRLTLE